MTTEAHRAAAEAASELAKHAGELCAMHRMRAQACHGAVTAYQCGTCGAMRTRFCETCLRRDIDAAHAKVKELQ